MTIAAVLRGKAEQGAGDIAQVAPGSSVRELVALLAERRIGAVPVVDDSGVIGILSERDVVALLAREGGAALDRTVEQVMTRDAITVAPETAVLAGLSLMTRRRIRHLPVIHEGRMIGFVSIGDLVKARIDGIESEAAALRSYIAG